MRIFVIFFLFMVVKSSFWMGVYPSYYYMCHAGREVNKIIGQQNGWIKNGIRSSTLFHRTAKWNDVVINEIFADPTPTVGLPAKEYIELYNTTDSFILLKGWKYADKTSTYTFSADTLAPHQYLILCAIADKSDFTQYGNIKGISPWPSLNNDGDLLSLSDENGIAIDVVSYNISWYKDAKKKSGGYSLERLDPKNICTGIQNWKASADSIGGTPGKVNSLYQSQLSSIKPLLSNLSIIDSVTLLLEFSKYIDSTSAADARKYQLNNGLGIPIGVKPISPEFTQVQLTLKTPIGKGRENMLRVSGLSDCAGNVMEEISLPIFLPEPLAAGDILINELLFNPRTDGVDFVEVYNASTKKVDLRMLEIYNSASSSSFASARKFANPIYISPGGYFVFASDPARVQRQYETRSTDNFIQISLPSFKLASGMALLKSANVEIDRLNYNEEMHGAIFKDVKGVSLERVSFSKATNAPGNFVSASATAGYATPGYVNSMHESAAEEKVRLALKEKVFSPDNDGIADQLEVLYKSPAPGKIGNLTIYDDLGNIVRKLMRNHNLATEGRLFWDGLNDSGHKCRVGIYILSLEVFDISGKTGRYFTSCVLAEKL